MVEVKAEQISDSSPVTAPLNSDIVVDSPA